MTREMILRDGTVVDSPGPLTGNHNQALVKVQQHSDESVLVRVCHKRLTADISADFKQAMAKIVDNGDINLVLDLSRVEYMDSSGLGALVAIRKAIHPEGTLKLCGINEHVVSLIMLTQLSKVFDIYNDTEQARAA